VRKSVHFYWWRAAAIKGPQLSGSVSERNASAREHQRLSSTNFESSWCQCACTHSETRWSREWLCLCKLRCSMAGAAGAAAGDTAMLQCRRTGCVQNVNYIYIQSPDWSMISAYTHSRLHLFLCSR
jgi:hypothetical protein